MEKSRWYMLAGNAMIRTAMETRFGGLFAQPQFSADNAAGTAVLARVMQEDSV